MDPTPFAPTCLRLAWNFDRAGSLVRCPHCIGRGILFLYDSRWDECRSCLGWGSIALPMEAAQADRFDEDSYAHALLFGVFGAPDRRGPHGVLTADFSLTAKIA